MKKTKELYCEICGKLITKGFPSETTIKEYGICAEHFDKIIQKGNLFFFNLKKYIKLFLFIKNSIIKFNKLIF